MEQMCKPDNLEKKKKKEYIYGSNIKFKNPFFFKLVYHYAQ